MFLPLQTIDPEKIEIADSTAKAKLEGQIQALSSMSAQELIDTVVRGAIAVGGKILLAVIIYFVGRWVIRKLAALLEKIFEKRNVDTSLRTFVISLVKITLTVILIIILIDIIGFNTTSFIAIFASAGLAVGVALSGTLQNFAGGVMVLLMKPYRVGDFIEAQGNAGTVKSIQLFNTVITTPDNKTIIIPNGPMSTGIINNYSISGKRRIEWAFRIPTGESCQNARDLILKVLRQDERIIDSPAPEILVNEIADNGIKLLVRAWAPAAKYWEIYYDINEKVYKTFTDAGTIKEDNKTDIRLDPPAQKN